tara:strand:- start:2071 stop:2697 length:627 start_codon:yes stop_codon:yes gene_type:complete
MKIIHSSGVHKITVIILHGFNQDISEMEYISNLINKEHDLIKWVILEGEDMKWYDYYTYRDNHNRHDKINYDQFKYSCEYLKKIIQRELIDIDCNNLYLVGISQGGTICINTTIGLNCILGGTICIDTIFLSDYMSDISFVEQVFYVLISKKDTVYNPKFQNTCYNLLRFFGNKIHFTKRDAQHCESTTYICNYIKGILQKNKLLKKL